MVAEVEVTAPWLVVWTDRECRRREADCEGAYSVDCHVRNGTQRRWPDMVIEGEEVVIAIELEIAAKTTKRLEAILRGYAIHRTYRQVQVRCAHLPLRRRLERVLKDAYYAHRVTLADRDEDVDWLVALVSKVAEREREAALAREQRAAEQARQEAVERARQEASYTTNPPTPPLGQHGEPEREHRRFGRKRQPRERFDL